MKKSNFQRKLYLSMVIYICLLFSPRLAEAQGGLSTLELELTRLGELSGGTMGVGVIHIESGQRVYINNGESYPMASTYKVPIAVQLLKRVEMKEITLDQMIEVQKYDLHPGSGTLSRLFVNPGVILSVRNLLELMMLISDNSATDIMLDTAGGSKRINKTLKKNKIRDMRVNRPTIKLIADWVGVDISGGKEFSNEAFIDKYESLSEEEIESSNRAFSRDPQDTSTPEAMAVLLDKIWNREILSPKYSELLIDIMGRCKTGEGRLKGMLPEETFVAHKTGTIGATTNDVGIIELPQNKGHVVVVAFVKDSELEIPKREKAIAHVARAAHDYFLFN